MTVALVSCDKEIKDSDYLQFVGHWAQSPGMEQCHYIFNSDKTGYFYIIDCTDNNRPISDTIYFSYKYNQKELLLTLNFTKADNVGETTEINIINSIDDNEIHWNRRGMEYLWIFYKQ